MARVKEDERTWADRDAVTKAFEADTDRSGLDTNSPEANMEDCEASEGLYWYVIKRNES